MIKALLIFFLKIYQKISPFFGQNCRFYPSCSNYAIEAIRVHGSIKGSWLTFKRLVKCGPWHKGGVDLVPKKGINKGS